MCRLSILPSPTAAPRNNLTHPDRSWTAGNHPYTRLNWHEPGLTISMLDILEPRITDHYSSILKAHTSYIHKQHQAPTLIAAGPGKNIRDGSGLPCIELNTREKLIP